ncbi:SRPBCC domain-containing protein [Streptomyces sp. WMMC940]|uniref:SRPBCC domain-containing protein n=1 Tax=Streptomyces sp. WMMC940 TaxID=3015153 RepID=UPI0022B612CC|nr:SRPBCC domain-containing protein [Streptomyces sp. WMMC940]MCZ7462342.1 SRPBCC domain-containing protein [Streptomyces sp. WMMC940]
MADIALQIRTAADPETLYRAISTPEGVGGWFTTGAEIGEGVGALHRLSFPGAQMTWDFRIDEAAVGKRLAQTVVAGPPQWIGTEIVYALDVQAEGETVVRFDHTGFAEIDDTFREVTMGWAGMLARLKEYVETGTPVPYFTP